jgi:hypothetical protein
MDSHLMAILGSVQLEIIHETNLLVCGRPGCLFALSPSAAQVTEYLRKRHDVASQKRRQVTDFLRTRLGALLQDPKVVNPRKDGSSVDRRLQRHEGFLCTSCGFRTVNKPTVVRHVSQEHPAIAQRVHGCAADVYIRVQLQSGTRNPAQSGYWTVIENTKHVGALQAEHVTPHMEQVPAREEQRQLRFPALPPSASTATYTEMRPWLERTDWNGHIRELTDMP